MTQRDRDRLIALKKAKKGLITQRQAALEIRQTERHIRRLLVKLKREGDQAVIHGRGGNDPTANWTRRVRPERWRFWGSGSIAGSDQRWPASTWASIIRSQ